MIGQYWGLIKAAQHAWREHSPREERLQRAASEVATAKGLSPAQTGELIVEARTAMRKQRDREEAARRQSALAAARALPRRTCRAVGIAFLIVFGLAAAAQLIDALIHGRIL